MFTNSKLWAVLSLILLIAARPAAAWFPQEESDLKPDPAAHFGSLPNGLRYVIRANGEPRDRISLRLLVLTGSVEEREDQRGLAHFLEHMAFNGSQHYAPGTLVEYFQRLGMSFGGDTNAYTSFDQTAYKIELPNARPDTLAEGLGVFADMAGSLLLRPDMIEKERPIILSEERTRDSVSYRQFVASFAFVLPDSLLPRRLPIGLKPVIEKAQRERFADYYDTWYRPERMVVIVVGAVEPEAVVPRIAAAFGGLRARGAARPDPDLGRVRPPAQLRTDFHPESTAPNTTVEIEVVRPYAHEADNSDLRRRHVRRDLAAAMLNRRFDILAKKEGAPFIRAQVGIEENFNFVQSAEVELKCLPGQWSQALAAGEQELRRALRYGFAPAELAEARANVRNDLEQAAAAATTQHSNAIADEIVNSLVDKRVFTSAPQNLALSRPMLDQTTPAQCADELRAAFRAPARDVLVAGNAVIPGDAAAAIARAYQASAAVAVAPLASNAAASFAYTDFGPSGQVAERRQVDDLGITELRFANGVRANLKPTPFEANRIRVRLRVGAGRLSEPAAQPGLAFFTDLTFGAGGLGRHSADDLQTILAGRTLDMAFSVHNDALEFSAATNREDLLTQLQLFAAYLTDPGYRPESVRTAHKALTEMYNQFDHVVQGPLRATVPRLLAGGDPRFGLPDRATELSRSLDEERAWLGPQLAAGPIEIALAGDFSPEAAIDALARTLGALPPRSPKPGYEAERRVRFPAAPPEPLRYTVESPIPKAAVALYWPTADAREVHRTRRLNLLSEVFGDRMRLRLREQLGDAYNYQALSDPSDTFTDYGRFIAEVTVAPGKVDEALASILAIASDLQAHGVTADELERAKKPLLTQLRDSARTNPYWITAVLGNCQEYPDRLDWARTRESDVAAATPAEVSRLAAEYLVPGRSFKVLVTPGLK